jgi:hypothetical protein
MAEMSEAAREARRAYYREWNKNNKEKVQEHQRRYWERKAAKAKEQEQAKAKRGKTGGGKE